MNITYQELRQIKHNLPTGSISKIASQLDVDEQTVRNYFGAKKYANGQLVGKHIQPGPNGGIVNLEDSTILDLAKKIIKASDLVSQV
jgi:predicted transcriptional regulator